jgi:hypothetical protein
VKNGMDSLPLVLIAAMLELMMKTPPSGFELNVVEASFKRKL